MVNHFGYDIIWPVSAESIRRDLRLTQRLSYAIFDFDWSIMLPPDADKAAYRRPYYQSCGFFNGLEDTAGGEFDYNPFKFEVGVMGQLIRANFAVSSYQA